MFWNDIFDDANPDENHHHWRALGASEPTSLSVISIWNLLAHQFCNPCYTGGNVMWLGTNNILCIHVSDRVPSLPLSTNVTQNRRSVWYDGPFCMASNGKNSERGSNKVDYTASPEGRVIRFNSMSVDQSCAGMHHNTPSSSFAEMKHDCIGNKARSVRFLAATGVGWRFFMVRLSL